MTMQSTVRLAQGSGIVGEFAYEGPTRSKALILDSADAANNVVGRAFTYNGEGKAQAGGAAGVFAGILCNPKSYAAFGTVAGGPLAPTMLLPNGALGEFCSMGILWVLVTADAAIGDPLKYTDATGVIGTGAPAAGETAIPNSKLEYIDPTGAGLAIAVLTN